MVVDQLWSSTKRLGPVWERLITWGVIGEEDALLLASHSPESRPTFFYSDAGAKFILSILLQNEVERARKADENPGRRKQHIRDLVEAGLRLATREGVEDKDARIMKVLGERLPPPEITLAIADLKASGDYDRIVAEASACPDEG
jgi:hypothetical protein